MIDHLPETQGPWARRKLAPSELTQLERVAPEALARSCGGLAETLTVTHLSVTGCLFTTVMSGPAGGEPPHTTSRPTATSDGARRRQPAARDAPIGGRSRALVGENPPDVHSRVAFAVATADDRSFGRLGGAQLERRGASSVASTSSSSDRVCDSMTMRSRSATSAVGPPAASSVAMWAMQNPLGSTREAAVGDHYGVPRATGAVEAVAVHPPNFATLASGAGREAVAVKHPGVQNRPKHDGKACRRRWGRALRLRPRAYFG